MENETLKNLLRLLLVPGIGAVRLNRLLDHFGTPEEVLAAPKGLLNEVDGLGEFARDSLLARGWDESNVEFQVGQAVKTGARAIARWDDEYPAMLREIYDIPPLLFVHGNLESLQTPSVAVVGTRDPSIYGSRMAKELAGGLAAAGYTVVSGLAYGVDSIAHHAALDSDGRTIAVLGSGLDLIYPSQNKDLAKRICENGCIVSEFMMGTQPDSKNFPRRNRIISGLSLGVLVVEAGVKSGALITARYALDQNRDVFAVPGDVSRGGSHGTNRLISEGARLVQELKDILDELRGVSDVPKQKTPKEVQTRLLPETRPAPEPSLSVEERKVYKGITEEPVHVDEIADRLGMDVSALLGVLLRLQMKSLIREYPGKLYSLE